MEGSSGGNDMELLSKTLQVEHKLFYFDLKENPRGQYLKISEKTSATRSTIIVPVEGISWVQVEGLALVVEVVVLVQGRLAQI
ncbi:hypothetical protein HHK36_027293 [Tetracentron sinense]|uniref:Uncharacterized protein n=1 Tax=Tetracentron sinense TaxID=13715 RepID=A0A834YK71_TETSI|nr:hypothetical protein HHK36_027293 [Tetracentron sinense]